MQFPRVRAVLTGAVLFILSASTISAQSPIERRMTLRLTDPSGAVVANGIATLRSNQTAQTYSLPLDLNKEFLLPKLSPGSYILVVEAPGFRKVEQVVELADGTRRLCKSFFKLQAVRPRAPSPTVPLATSLTRW